MGAASISFIFNFRSVENLDHLISSLLTVFPIQLIQPKSMQLVLTGTGIAHKFPTSVDGEMLRISTWGLPLLDTERRLQGTEFTVLDEPDRWLTLPRDMGEVMTRLASFQDEARRLGKKMSVPDPWIDWRWWGLTNIVYRDAANRLAKSWVFRERLSIYNEWVAIIEVTCGIPLDQSGQFQLCLSTRSHIFSFFSSDFDQDQMAWIQKVDTSAERENAKLLARAVARLVVDIPKTTFSWRLDSSGHTPDLAGAVPSELTGLFGGV